MVCCDDDKLVPCFWFWQRAKNVHGDKFQGPAARKDFQVGLPTEARSVYSEFTAVADYRVGVVGHMRPVELMTNSILHTTLAMGSHQFEKMLQVENA